MKSPIPIITFALFVITTSSQALHLEFVSSLHTSSHYSDIFVSGQYAYAATVWGLEIIDISEPDNPVKIGGIRLHMACLKIGCYIMLKGWYYRPHCKLI